jgi:CBS-domain-containing membrane protein
VIGLAFGAIFSFIGLLIVYRAANGELPASMMSNGGWVVVIGIFLFAAAQASRRQAAMRQSLATIPVRDIMVKTVVSIPAQCALDEAVNRYFQAYGYGGFPVLADRRLVGMVTVSEMQAVAPALWAWRRVEQVMRPFSESLAITPEAPVIHAMERMASGGWDRLVVVQDGDVVGLVTQSAILHALRLRKG